MNEARLAWLALLFSGCAAAPVVAAPNEASSQPLTAKQIQDPVIARAGAFQACYELAQADDRNTRDQFAIAFSIAADGSVERASVVGGHGVARLEGCVMRQFLRLRFPASSQGTKATFPFAFQPPPAADTP